MDHAFALAIGLVLGVLTGIPLGVVNVAVVELASRDRRAATWLGAGGALADAIHAAIATVGWGAIVARSAAATRVLAIASAVIVVGYAAYVVHARPERREIRRSGIAAFATGLALTLPNPGALMAWTAVAAALAPSPVMAIGVGIGSATWFAVLARLADRIRLDERRWIVWVVGGVMVAIALVGVIRTVARP
jgi:threonine/homoserine/homoserine lactone efflux protein